jgi:hypothetical protein
MRFKSSGGAVMRRGLDSGKWEVWRRRMREFERGTETVAAFCGRLGVSVKYENIYLHGYETAVELERGLASYFDFYRYERLHMALGYQTPWEMYSTGRRVRRAL